MSEIKVNKVSPRTNCGTVQLGDSGDTITIPSGVTMTNNGTAAGFGSTGEVSWNTTKITADPGPAVSGVGYFTDTSGAAFSVTLPLNPSAGAVVAVADYANTWDTKNLTIARNGQNIEGAASDFVCNVEGASLTLVYVDATKGWLVTNAGNSTSGFQDLLLAATGGTVSTDGNCKIHTFTGPGTFAITNAATCATNNIVSYLVVGGGGGAGHNNYAGGGGAGGYREVKTPTTPYTASPLDGYPTPGNRITISASPGSYPIVVGSGGAGGGNGGKGATGSVSTFSTISSAGGGGGGAYTGGGGNDATDGGSGGGGSANAGAAGTGNTPPVTPAQGTNGGAGSGCSGGGGGGATTAGSTGGPVPAGSAGGTGATTNITASPLTKSAGGKGAGSSTPATNGAANSGDGGCRSNPGTFANGGSGIVVIRYKYQ